MVKKNITAVLFDLDGTLLDTAADFAAIINQLCREHRCPPVDYAALRAIVSHGARAMVCLAFGLTEQDPRVPELREQLLERYSHHLLVHTEPFAGIPELLQWLDEHAIAWGIVTNKPHQYAAALLSLLQWSERCGVLICPEDVQYPKPHPEPLLSACHALRCTPDEAVYVGDHQRDIESGKNARITTIAATYGYLHADEPSEAWGADFYAATPAEIQSILQALIK